MAFQNVLEYGRARGNRVIYLIITILLFFVGLITIYYILIKPENTYKKAHDLLTEGNYYESYELYHSIENYKDVKNFEEYIKYETIIFSCINDLVTSIKNPTSIKLISVEFYQSDDTVKNMKLYHERNEVDEKKPVCFIRFSKENEFGGTESAYSLFYYSRDTESYKLYGICRNLQNLNKEDNPYKTTEEFLSEIIINYQNDNCKVGKVDIERLNKIIENHPFSQIRIIE